MIVLLGIIIIVLLIVFAFVISVLLKTLEKKNVEIIKLIESANYHKKELEKRTNENFDDYLYLKHK